MSLDATILDVERDGPDLVLTLGPRITNDERLTLAGQARMLIVEATYVPEVGTDLWGGDGLVELCSKPKRMYRREGYTRMREIPPKDGQPQNAS